MVPEDKDRNLKLQVFVRTEISEAIEPSSRLQHMSAKDYVFYLRRQVAKDRGLEVLESVGSENEGFADELPRLLNRLEDELRCDNRNFLQDFVSDPQNGTVLLLDLLKNCHSRQTNQDKHGSAENKERKQLLKRALSDEYVCLLCLKNTLQLHKSIMSIAQHHSGLSVLASCIMSTFTKSRVVALEILTKVCKEFPEGYKKTLEAMSSVKLIFGESVRFKFLVSMLMGCSKSAHEFEKVSLLFLNTLLLKCVRPADRVRLQCEIEEAGLDIDVLEKNLQKKNTSPGDEVWNEIQKWKDNYLDVEATLKESRTILSLNSTLRHEVDLLRRAIAKLEEDKISLMLIERELKDRCEDLEQELSIIKRTRNSLETVDKMAETDHSVNLEGTTKADDSDDSDFIATDSGRHSFQTEEENDQPESEEILIDIPTIRPPIGFRSPVEEEGHEPQNTSPGHSPNMDSDLEWTYPKIPKVKIIHSNFENSEQLFKETADKNEWLPEKGMKLFQNEEVLRSSCRSFNRHIGNQYSSSLDSRRYQQKRNSAIEKRHRSLDSTDIHCRRNQRKESRSVDRLYLRDVLHHRISNNSEVSDFINEETEGKKYNHEQENWNTNELCGNKSGNIKNNLNEFGDIENGSTDRETISNNWKTGHSDELVRRSPPQEENNKHLKNEYNFLPENSNQFRKQDKKKVWDIFNVDLPHAIEYNGGSTEPRYKITNSDEFGERRLETVVEEKPHWKNDDTICVDINRPSISVQDEKEVKYFLSSGFFFRPNISLFGSSLDVEPDQTQKNTLLEKPIRPVTKIFPLPAAYKNSFLLRRKFNSDLYSGVDKTTNGASSLYDTCNNDKNHVPTDSISALVHREITEAVKEMNGWL
ncbi:uncharacterized protein LOC143255116 isoform X2 [Tachypleus tridentatus]